MIYADKCRLIDAERKYNPQGGSLFVCVITQGSLLSSATPGYRKYNRVAVVFHPLPAHRNEWDGWADGLLAYSIEWDSRARRLSIYSIGWNGRARRLLNGFILKNDLELPSLAITTSRYREKYPRPR